MGYVERKKKREITVNVTIVTYNVRGKNQKKMMTVHEEESIHACMLFDIHECFTSTLISLEILKGMIYGERWIDEDYCESNGGYGMIWIGLLVSSPPFFMNIVMSVKGANVC